jgi:hypothetical protein
MKPSLDQLLYPVAYQLEWDEFSSVDVQLVMVRSRNGALLWAIRELGMCYGKGGRWSYEPQPSSRTDEWLKVYRFATKEAALSTWFNTHGRSRFSRKSQPSAFAMLRPEGI